MSDKLPDQISAAFPFLTMQKEVRAYKSSNIATSNGEFEMYTTWDNDLLQLVQASLFFIFLGRAAQTTRERSIAYVTRPKIIPVEFCLHPVVGQRPQQLLVVSVRR